MTISDDTRIAPAFQRHHADLGTLSAAERLSDLAALDLDTLVHRVATLQGQRLVCRHIDPAGWDRIEDCLAELRGELDRRADALWAKVAVIAAAA